MPLCPLRVIAVSTVAAAGGQGDAAIRKGRIGKRTWNKWIGRIAGKVMRR